MLLKDLIKNYYPVYPPKVEKSEDSWHNTVEYLYATESKHMVALEESVNKYGMRDPILLEEGYSDSELAHLIVGDGTHRVALAIKLGLKEVPVNFKTESHDEESYYLSLVVTLQTLGVAHDFFEDEATDIFWLSRSFKVNEKEWMTSSGGSSTNDQKWDLYLDTLDEAFAERARLKFEEILESTFPDFEFTVCVEKEFYEE